MTDVVTGAPRVSSATIGPSQMELWPFRVNWGEQVSESIEFRTDIFESRSGREQRRALRDKPRWRYGFASWTAAASYQRFAQLIRGRGGLQFCFRHPVDQVELDVASNIGDTALEVAALPEWAQPGVLIILDGGATQELCKIASASGILININGALINAWPEGTRIRRAMAGRLDQPFGYEMLTNTVAAFNAKFLMDPDGSYALDPETAAVTFDGRELFLTKPNWNQPVSFDFDFNRQSVDYGLGRIAHNLPKNTYKSVRKASFLGKSRDEILDLMRFFLRMKGQRGEFYAPTLTDDITATSISGGFVDVAGLDLYRSLQGELTNKAVTARKRDGTYLISKIASVANNAGNTRITLTTSWGTVAVDTVMSIQFVSLWRFASDTLSVDWINSQTANMVMTFNSLENQASE